MKLLVGGIAAAALLMLGGCPGRQPDSPVKAQIDASAVGGPVPVSISFSGLRSSTQNGGELTYAWDFGGDGTATTPEVTHTFSRAGFYVVTLTVQDSTAAADTASIDIRARGADPTAAIRATPTSGTAPLMVTFDGGDSSAPDDVIRDYEWDFDDATAHGHGESTLHRFERGGTYDVELTVTTAGGASATATQTIVVAKPPSASLQFDGTQLATLPLAGERTLANWAFEAWVNAGSAGGEVVRTSDGAFVLEVLPLENRIAFEIGGERYEVTATGLAGGWRHVALTNASAGNTVLYLDGGDVLSVAGALEFSTDQLDLGAGFTGRLSDIRLWWEERTAGQIAENYDRRLTSTAGGLLGYWRLDEGVGQTLDNSGTAAADGVRGSGLAREDADPAWSTAAPDID